MENSLKGKDKKIFAQDKKLKLVEKENGVLKSKLTTEKNKKKEEQGSQDPELMKALEQIAIMESKSYNDRCVSLR